LLGRDDPARTGEIRDVKSRLRRHASKIRDSSTESGVEGLTTQSGSLLVISGIKKAFGGVQALKGIDLKIEAGAVHAICGENGAGKSTLMKIIAGAEQADEGKLLLDGEVVAFADVKAAAAAGIATVFQETMLFGTLDVFANLFSGRIPTRWGVLHRGAKVAEVEAVLKTVGLDVPLDRLVSDLTLAERQLVEVARALLIDAQMLILDEPNSALRPAESERLFQVVRTLTKRGVAVIYVSHRLEEVFNLAQTITVMRNGNVIETKPIGELTLPDVVTMMIGRPRHNVSRPKVQARPSGDPALSLRGVSTATGLRDVDLEIYPGEVVGLAGLEGSGPIELMRLIYGRRRVTKGTVSLLDGHAAPKHPASAVRRGIALVPSDRANEGLFLFQSVLDNAIQVHSGVLGRSGFILRNRDLTRAGNEALGGLRVTMASLHQAVGSLSGGNQQKVVFAKWRILSPNLVLLEDPTRGVDVGAKDEIFDAVRLWAAEGKAVLISTSEFTEYQLVCDRVFVFARGSIVGEVPGHVATENFLLEAINTEHLPLDISSEVT
jgi:ABC-type sugar transport system ATPase subunit